MSERISKRRRAASVAILAVGGGCFLAYLVVVRREPVRLPIGTAVVIDGVTYGQNEFVRYLGKPPGFVDENEARSAIEGFVDFLLIQHAAEREKNPAANVIQQIVGDDFKVTDAKVEAYYERDRVKYVHPRIVRLGYFKVVSHGQPAVERQRSEALYIEAQIDARPDKFSQLLARRWPDVESGEVSVPCTGTPGSAPVPEPVQRLGCSLRPGRLGGPIETPEGVFVVKLINQVQAQHRTLDQVRDEIRGQLTVRTREQARAAALARLRGQASVTIPPGAAASLVAPPQHGRGRALPGAPIPPPVQQESPS